MTNGMTHDELVAALTETQQSPRCGCSLCKERAQLQADALEAALRICYADNEKTWAKARAAYAKKWGGEGNMS